MIDPADKKTLPLIDPPRRRGRPPTGKAMTAAQRKRIQRLRARDDPTIGTHGADLQDKSMTALLDALARFVRVGYPEGVERISTELIRRARENDKA